MGISGPMALLGVGGYVQWGVYPPLLDMGPKGVGTHPPTPDMGYCWQLSGTHHTGMLSSIYFEH